MTLGYTGLESFPSNLIVEKLLRKVTLLFGIILLLAGVFSEAMYITTSKVAYQGAIVPDTYLVLGVISIFIGFIFMLTSVKIPKTRVW